MVFPEGGRSPDGWGQPFRAGAAYLSIKCDAPVVPIHLSEPATSFVKVKCGPSDHRQKLHLVPRFGQVKRRTAGPSQKDRAGSCGVSR
ncbi:MAG: hypothetical protein CM15mP49_03810 [Actinomycetota bacterium]|nr:MAG: hypothetical protein CM15mP49_03810 [Actinomycetota bacterium]